MADTDSPAGAPVKAASPVPSGNRRDIIDRLYHAAGNPTPGKACAYTPISLLVEAAQEIDQLRGSQRRYLSAQDNTDGPS